jgi:SAM-dependent methyltransferase
MEYKDIVWSTALERLDRAISYANCNRVYADHTEPWYPYIPFDMATFIHEMEVLRQMLRPNGHIRPKFIDVGCGVGTKLIIAQQFGFECYGIELDAELVKIAKQLRFQVERGNAIRADYSIYDAIYFYCPIRDPELEAKLERRIINTAKPGALIVGNMKCGDWSELRDRVWTERDVELVCRGIGYGYSAFEVHRKR